MERYLDQLIADLRKRALEVPPAREFWLGVDMADKYGVEDLAYVEQYLHGTPQPLSEILEIEQAQLPPVHRLTDQQVARLYPEVEKLLNAFHFFPDYPEGLAVLEKYRTLRSAWNMDVVLVGGGENHIEFCEEAEGCPFPPEFCLCKEAEEQMKWDEEQAKQWRKRKDDEGDWEVPF